MAEAATYPKRGSHFAHEFTRKLFKSCVAQRVGTDGIALLTLIVHTEDAAHYKRPIDFYNSQLAPMLGISESALRRARERCVKAGWLVYRKGGTYRAGIYFVQIPEAATGIDDAPSDEGHILTATGGVSPPTRRRQDAVSPPLERRQTAANSSTSNPIPVPIPVPKEKPAATAAVSGEGKCPAGYTEAFDLAFNAFRKTGRGGLDKRKAMAAWWSAMGRLRKRGQPDPETWLLSRINAYGASATGQGEYAKGMPSWLNGESYDDDDAKWNQKRAGPVNGHDRAAQVDLAFDAAQEKWDAWTKRNATAAQAAPRLTGPPG